MKHSVPVTSNPEASINANFNAITLAVIYCCLVSVSKSESLKPVVINVRHSNMDTQFPMQYFQNEEQMRRLQAEAQVMDRLMREEQHDAASQ